MSEEEVTITKKEYELLQVFKRIVAYLSYLGVLTTKAGAEAIQMAVGDHNDDESE